MALSRGKTWAWWGALFATVIVLVVGAGLVYSALFSDDPYIRSEAIYVLGMGIILATPAAMSLLLLLLPGVRQRFFPHRVSLM